MTEIRKFALTLAALLLLFFEAWPYYARGRYFIWPFVTSAVLLFLAAFFPNALIPVRHLWNKIGEVLGMINSYLILGVFFFLAFMPVSFWRRLRGVDPLKRRPDLTQTTYRVNRQKRADGPSMERTF